MWGLERGRCSGYGTASFRPQYAHAVPETSYAKCGDLSLAYQVFGDGPVELVFVGPMVFHVELFWVIPEFKAFFDQLATFCRVVMFDKAGNGLSDPISKVRLLEERAAEIEAVMDAVGFGKPVLFGLSEGGPQSIVFAAKRPERTRALILYGALPGGLGLIGATWDDLDRDPAELRTRALAELGEDYTPSTKQFAQIQEFGRAVRSAWGSGATVKWMSPSNRSMRQIATFERMCASPGMVRAALEANFRIDIRPILPTIAAPTRKRMRRRGAGGAVSACVVVGCVVGVSTVMVAAWLPGRTCSVMTGQLSRGAPPRASRTR